MQKNKRQNLFKKFIANFLVVVFLSVSLPMSVFADEIEKITSVNEEIYKEEVINDYIHSFTWRKAKNIKAEDFFVFAEKNQAVFRIKRQPET